MTRLFASITSVLAVLGVAASPAREEQESTTAPGEQRWPLGFRVKTVEELPQGNWIEYWPYECVFEVEGDSAALHVSFDKNDGYVGNKVHIWLTPSGAQATAFHGDCTSFWFGEHLAGTSCLVTDGKTAVLQFEIYDGGTDWFGRKLRGQADLGVRGADFARRIEAPSSASEVHLERVQGTYSDVPFEAFGLVDAFGRRQGLWTVREVGKEEPSLEASWRDGLPHGFHRRHEDEHILLRTGMFVAGFQEGQEVEWRRTGERTITVWSRGSQRRFTSYRVDGTRLHDRTHDFLNLDASRAHWKKVRQLHTRR